MTAYRMSPESWMHFVRTLIEDDTPVYGPVSCGDGFNFKPLQRAEDLRLDAPTTISPPTKLILRDEVMVRYRLCGTGIDVDRVLPVEEPIIIVGMQPCDVVALNIVDQVYLDGPIPDPFYRARRTATSIIAMDFMAPPPHSFCASVGTHVVTRGFDLLVTPLAEKYLIDVGTEAGANLLAVCGVLPVATEADMQERNEHRDSIARAYPEYLPVPTHELHRLFEGVEGSYWESMAKACASCKACTMVCPTCTCWTFERKATLDGSGCNVRTCTSCLSQRFALVAGHNFRETLAVRLRHRALDKLVYGQLRGRTIHCTGCGRCATACKTGIASPAVLAHTIHAWKENRRHV